MTLLNVLFTSSAVALSVLVNSVSVANAVAVHGGSGLNARSAHSPNHNGVMKRKRSHKNRKRCVQQPVGASSSSDPNANGGSTPTSTNTGNAAAAYTPPPTNNQSNPAQTCGNGAKVGLAWGPSMPSNYIPNATTYKTCWYYNWSAWAADPSLTGSLKFVPMLWGQNSVGDFMSQVVDSGTNYGIALAMNEVNQAGQAQMGVQDGINMWNQYMVPLKSRGYTIISPSTTSAPDGIQWLQAFMSSGQLGAMPDAMAVHWYGMSFQDFKSYIDTFAATFPGMPIWITEFACTNFADGGCDTMAFANQAIPYLDGNPNVQAYFPFAFDATMSNVGEPSRLMNYDGSLTALGSRYLY